MLEILFSASINMSVILKYITVLLLKKYIYLSKSQPENDDRIIVFYARALFMRIMRVILMSHNLK